MHNMRRASRVSIRSLVTARHARPSSDTGDQSAKSGPYQRARFGATTEDAKAPTFDFERYDHITLKNGHLPGLGGSRLIMNTSWFENGNMIF